MLQQTQVATVIPYYARFLERFPDVAALASAPLDDVLALWSGLGYYARARNLHRAAGIVRDAHDGEMPADFDALVALPGIGRSTAGAILSIACGQRHAILDGNVKRVLARQSGIREWTGKTATLRELWILAEELTPSSRVADYTQAIMDLGATLCTRSKPSCDACPVANACIAKHENLQQQIPAAKPKRAKPRRSVAMLVVRDPSGAVLLEKRPPAGIWGGLFSLPELPEESTLEAWGNDLIRAPINVMEALEPIMHSFTHFDLEIRPMVVSIEAVQPAVMDRSDRVWYKRGASQPLGMPAPVSRLLESLQFDA